MILGRPFHRFLIAFPLIFIAFAVALPSLCFKFKPRGGVRSERGGKKEITALPVHMSRKVLSFLLALDFIQGLKFAGYLV